MAWLQRTASRIRALLRPVPEIPSTLWLQVLQKHPFLQALSLEEKSKLRALSALFLRNKQFSGAHGLEVSDSMALTIAAQACVPLLYRGEAQKAIRVYDDFVGIVVHPGTMVAARDVHDEAGLVSHRRMMLEGEAMERGPVMLSWPAVDGAGQGGSDGQPVATSVVIHEFVHKIDMRNGPADGCPPLPPGFMGTRGARAAHAAWRDAWEPAYEQFREQVIIAERFGGAWPWLDAYGATAPAEFFAVACEAYFVHRERFGQEFPTLLPVLDAFFGRPLSG